MTRNTTKYGLLLGAALCALSSPAFAADLGGQCCSDLEERIAELEATTARKGNRKVSLQIYGQVSAELLHVSVADFDDTTVTQSGSDSQGTYVGFSGNAKISSEMSAGFVLEIDMRQRSLPDDLLGVGIGGNVDPGVRQSFFWVRSENIGTFSLGRMGVATNKFDEIGTAPTYLVSRPNSLQPISDAYLTGVDIPYDGTYRDLVRYDSPTIAGFTLSATWGDAVSATDPDGNGNTYDVALRYAGEFSGFQVAAGLGWRHDEDFTIKLVDVTSITIGTGDVETILASGSVKHVQSGLFMSAYYADQDWDLGLNLKTWTVQGGISSKWLTNLGATTAFAEYSETDASITGLGSADIPVYGVGFVQSIDAAAMDLFVGYRQYDLDELVGEKVDLIHGGARIRF
jgi:predicted porin